MLRCFVCGAGSTSFIVSFTDVGLIGAGLRRDMLLIFKSLWLCWLYYLVISQYFCGQVLVPI